MPEVLATWIETQSFIAVSEVQQELLATYRDDFSKYSAKSQKEVLGEVMKSVPLMLGTKIKYANISRELRSDAIKKALDLIVTARICHKVFSASADGIPLGATVNYKKFKTIFLDSGLVAASLGLRMDAEMKMTDLILVNKGAVAEQVVGQMLRTVEESYAGAALYYWARDKKGSEAEVDYLMQCNTAIIPIEVKSGNTGSMKSLHSLMSHKKLDYAVRVNTDLPSLVQVNHKINSTERVDYTLLSLPLYMTEQIKRLSIDML